ncbi:MAG: hypothetical protein NDI61_11715 [Bdellovibrionaceae bacterium]|nr:hypothetical protein [Pseudobdellovibrionaceae bacterium]
MADERDDTKDTREDVERGGISVGDTLKKLLTAGVSAAFMTEESIRSFVSELKLPKETLNLLLAGAAKSKEELTHRVSREIINIISKIDFVKEASRFVEEHKFKISAEIEVIRKEKSDKPNEAGGPDSQVQTRVTVDSKAESKTDSKSDPKAESKSRS